MENNQNQDPVTTSPFPVPIRARIDGWTPDRQRAFIEALADCGIIREAAARVGMSEKSVARLRRRDDAAAFRTACDRALRLGAGRLRSVAFERAVEGTIKRHYYHGELRAEERVFDNRLLTYLLGRVGGLFPRAPDEWSIEHDWQHQLDALDGSAEREPVWTGDEIWELDGEWWTKFPPPADFRGVEIGEPEDSGYRRMLSEAEVDAINRDMELDAADRVAALRRKRDLFFGFKGEDSAPREAGPSRPSEESELCDDSPKSAMTTP